MKMTADNLITKLDDFVVSHVIPNCNSETSRYLSGFARPLLRATAKKMLGDIPDGIGLRDQDGNIDIDILKECVKSGFDAAGSVRLSGLLKLRFEQSDADAFFASL